MTYETMLHWPRIEPVSIQWEKGEKGRSLDQQSRMALRRHKYKIHSCVCLLVCIYVHHNLHYQYIDHLLMWAPLSTCTAMFLRVLSRQGQIHISAFYITHGRAMTISSDQIETLNPSVVAHQRDLIWTLGGVNEHMKLFLFN